MEDKRIETSFMLEEQKQGSGKKAESKLEATVGTGETSKIKKVFFHVNTEEAEADSPIKGCVIVFDADTNMSTSFMRADMFGQVMLFSVKKLNEDGEKVSLEDSDFSGRDSVAIDNLNYVIPEERTSATAIGPSLKCMASSDKLEDAAEWQSVLGVNGRVGLYQREISHDEYEYVLLVHVDQTQASEELYQWVFSLERDSMTISEFEKSVKYKYVQAINRRNAQRLAAKAAQALGLYVDTEEDVNAYVSSVHKTKPRLAIPLAHNEYNIFYQGGWKGSRAILFYDNTVCTMRAKKALMLMEDARSPIHVFPTTLSSSLTGGMDVDGVTLNKAGLSFPVTMGTTKNVPDYLASLSQKERASLLSQKDREQINRRITWEGKDRNSTQPSAWFNHKVVHSLSKHFEPKDAEQAAIFSQLYESGHLSHVQTFKPVLVKISKEHVSGY